MFFRPHMKKLAYLTLFTSLFINIVGVSSAFSRTYTGYIERNNNTFYVVKNNLKLEMQFVDASIHKVLKNLTTKDYISVDANLLPAEENTKKAIKVIVVSSINYVGLNEMIGFWKDRTGLCYYFIGFTKIKVFIPGPQLKCHPSSIPEIHRGNLTSYNYFINPNDDIWMMLISNEKSQYLAELSTISSTKKKLVMYNAEDGKELSSVILYKANQ
jgi:hypothetical protein